MRNLFWGNAVVVIYANILEDEQKGVAAQIVGDHREPEALL